MLPAILGMAAQALIPTTVMPAFLAGAIGSGVGSLLQGGTTDEALEAAALGGLGGAIGGQLGGAGSDATKMAVMDTPIKGVSQLSSAGAPMSVPAGGNIPSLDTLKSGLTSTASSPSFLSQLGTPTAIGTGLGASFAAPPPMKKVEDDFVAPRGKPISGDVRAMPDDYEPGKDPEFDFGFQRNFQEGGLVALGKEMEGEGQMNDKELISAAVEAIKGTSENPEVILGQFLAKFGEDALRDLVDKVQSGQFDENTGEGDGMVKGMGDGMDDMIPASLEGEQDVLLSDGEFVVPADVVSGLGNGSSDAGADKLENMMDRVRELRTGGKMQPPDIPDEMMLPA
tara:strand:+ start:25 stop:1044 length:1020 start_codon:yes stop_codon:yes gene_type:complete